MVSDQTAAESVPRRSMIFVVEIGLTNHEQVTAFFSDITGDVYGLRDHPQSSTFALLNKTLKTVTGNPK